MPQQIPHPSGKVVSVRLPKDVIDLLDSLADRTERSRGFYIREALLEALPKIEETLLGPQHTQRRPQGKRGSSESRV